MSWLTRAWNTWRQRQLDTDLDSELEFHLGTRVDHNLREGMSLRDAHLEARRDFGNVTRAREQMREARVLVWLDEAVGDARFGARIFGRRFLLSALAVGMLSLGIGANAAIFSVVRAVWLRASAFADADRLVMLLDREADGGLTTPTVPEILDLRRASRTLDALSFFDTRDFQLTGGLEPERVLGARIDPALLPMLGVRPAIGRTFEITNTTADDRAVVLADGVWRRNFGADSGAVGRRLELNGASYTIVGVLPPDVALSRLLATAPEVYVPYPTSADYTSRAGEYANVRRVTAIARIAPGVSEATVAAELRTVATRFAEQFPEIYRAAGSGFSMSLEPVQEYLTSRSRSILLLLTGIVGLLLLTACVNTAQFLLVHTMERQGEIALRAALGAGRWRLIRQLASETLLITGVGGALGVLQALWLTPVLRAIVALRTPGIERATIDGPVIGFMLGMTALTSLVCVLVPVFRLSHADLAGRIENRSARIGRLQARQWFIVAEVAMSVVLLAGAGILLRSLHELQQNQGGFAAERVSMLRVRGMASGPQLGELYSRYIERMTLLPAIEAVAATSRPLPGQPGTSFTIPAAGTDPSAPAEQVASYQIVSGGYFGALGIPLEEGRRFTDDDRTGRPPVAIVNREMADRFWPGRSPVGQTIRAGDGPRDATMTVVGVVGNVRPPLQVGDVPQIYVSHLQQSEPNISLLVRTRPGAALPLAEIKQAIRSVDARQAVFGLATLDDWLSRATASQQAVAKLTSAFAALAVIMSVVGLYIVLMSVAARRSREIAVRRAVGASDRDIVWSVSAPTVRWTVVGLGIGGLGAVAISRALRAVLSGVSPLDATLMIFVGALYAAVVTAVVVAATRHALRAEPMAVLRAD